MMPGDSSSCGMNLVGYAWEESLRVVMGHFDEGALAITKDDFIFGLQKKQNVEGSTRSLLTKPTCGT